MNESETKAGYIYPKPNRWLAKSKDQKIVVIEAKAENHTNKYT
jgi:hypothetical protein